MRNEIEKKCYLCGSEDKNIAIIRNSPLKKEIGKMICMDCLPKSGIRKMKPMYIDEKK